MKTEIVLNQTPRVSLMLDHDQVRVDVDYSYDIDEEMLMLQQCGDQNFSREYAKDSLSEFINQFSQRITQGTGFEKIDQNWGDNFLVVHFSINYSANLGKQIQRLVNNIEEQNKKLVSRSLK